MWRAVRTATLTLGLFISIGPAQAQAFQMSLFTLPRNLYLALYLLKACREPCSYWRNCCR
jgi:hypothetical protein